MERQTFVGRLNACKEGELDEADGEDGQDDDEAEGAGDDDEIDED